MKNKLQFALERSLDAAKELIAREIDHIFAAFLQNDQKVNVPVNLDINLTGEGLVKFKSKVSYKGTVETEFEYDPDQIEMDFTFPGSNFGKLDLSQDDSTAGSSSTVDEKPENKPEKTPNTKDAAGKEAPALFS